MNVFRLHIRPSGGKADLVKSFNYCREKSVLGLGWSLDKIETISCWDVYESSAIEIYSEKGISRVKYFHDHICKRDLIWTRDMGGNYYLAKVLSPWEYVATQESLDADIVNICRCDVKQVEQADDVPGKIIACFRAPRTIQKIEDKTCKIYSQLLWNSLSSTRDYIVDDVSRNNIFSLLTSEECEDVIFIYLQTRGWIVIPNTRKADTMSYEFVLIRKAPPHERGIVQVKTGNAPLNRDELRNHTERVFLFQANGCYSGSETEGVDCILPRMLEKFMRENCSIMPKSIQRWLEFSETGKIVTS